MSQDSVKLGELLDITSGYAFKSKFFNGSGELPVIRIRDVARGFSETYYSGDYDPKYLADDGDLMISMDGEFRIKEWSGGKALINQRVCRVRPIDDRLDERYLFRLLPPKLKKIEDATPFVTVKHLSVKDIRNIEIPLPPLPEQKRIAAILDKADAIHRKRQEAIGLMSSLRWSCFFEFFGSPAANTRGWEEITLESLCKKITDGTHDTPERLTSGVLLITGKNIKPFRIDLEKIEYVSESDHKEIFKRCNPEYGDVLYTNIGVNMGTAVMNTFRDEFSMKNVALLKPKAEMIKSRYLEQVLNDNQMLAKILGRSGRGGAQGFLSLAQIRATKIPVPPLELQEKFELVVGNIQLLISSMSEGAKDNEQLFKSLSQRAFKGEL